MNAPHTAAQLAAANFADLTDLYFTHSRAPYALAAFDHNERALNRLLRNHLCHDIRSIMELELRDAFDELLGFYARLEIACSLGFVKLSDDNVVAAARRVLSNIDVRRFYEVHYPLLLPQLFRERVHGRRDFVLSPEHVSLSAFFRFLDLNAVVEGEGNAKRFLSLIDDYILGDGIRSYGLSDLFQVVENAQRFSESMSLGQENCTELDAAVKGLCVFLKFCRGLSELLRSLDSCKIERSMFWQYHAYWFESIRTKLGGNLHETLKRFSKWESREPPAADSGMSSTDSTEDRSLESMHQVVRELTSGRYGWAIRESADTDYERLNPNS